VSRLHLLYPRSGVHGGPRRPWMRIAGFSPGRLRVNTTVTNSRFAHLARRAALFGIEPFVPAMRGLVAEELARCC
jgi:hypothetical protein